MSNNQVAYHEVDFLLPAQRFNIQFSYISQKGLPFYREYVLRVVYIAPVSKSQIAIFFGLSRREVDEVVSDLVERGELTLSNESRLTLTEKSRDYFFDLGESPKFSAVQDSGALLSFDLATFSCLGSDQNNDSWKAGLPLTVKSEHASRSEEFVEKHFQHQFNQICEKGFISKSIVQEGVDRPTIYTVNSVNKIRSLPLRLTTEFKMDESGRAVEREDFEQLNSSEYVHELMAHELSRLARPNNFMGIAQSMIQLGDEYTLKLFESSNGTFNQRYLEDLNKLEENGGYKRLTFLGPIYSSQNWALFKKQIAPILSERINNKADFGSNQFIWVAPSDPFWAKSDRFTSSLSSFLEKAIINEKKDRPSKRLYKPTIFVPLADADDKRMVRQWRNQLSPYHKHTRGLVEGFLGGSIEVIYLEDELVVVIYHIIQPETFPVTLPVGFISTDSEMVTRAGKLLKGYIQDSSGFDKPHDCGPI